jgi:hypothetical protein
MESSGLPIKTSAGSSNFETNLRIMANVSGPAGEVQTVPMPLLVDVPIVWPRAGGFALTFPVVAGDEVLVVFGSRCIDAWWQSGGVAVQAEARMHDLSDGFAVIGVTSQPRKLYNVSASNVQLRDDTGTTLVEIAPGGLIRVAAVAGINIEAPTVNITASAGINLDSANVTIGGIVFGTHRHSGVKSGPDNTGGPLN